MANLSGLTEVTVVAKVATSSVPADASERQTIFAAQDTTNGGYVYLRLDESAATSGNEGSITFIVSNADNTSYVWTPLSMEAAGAKAGDPIVCGGTFSAGSGTAFLAGNYTTTDNVVGDVLSATTNHDTMAIGYRPMQADRFFGGKVYWIKVYNWELEQSHFDTLNNGEHIGIGLIHHWEAEDIDHAAGTWPDRVGNAHGTLRTLVTPDPLWNNVALLMHFDGVDGTQTFVDSSNLKHQFTANSVNGPLLDGTNVKFGSASFFNNGSAYRISAPGDAVTRDGGDFTVEAQVKLLSSDLYGTICSTWGGSGSSGSGWFCGEYEGQLVFCWYAGSTFKFAISSDAPDLTDRFHHVAWCIESDVLRMFVDGVELTLDTSDVSDMTEPATAPPIYIGCDGAGANMFAGNIDELRITKGVARYTENFTPPSAQFGKGATYQSYVETWGDDSTARQSLFGPSGSKSMTVTDGVFQVTSATQSNTMARMDEFPDSSDFELEVDVTALASGSSAGVVYRQSYWGDGGGAIYAYRAVVYNSTLSLSTGGDAADGTHTTLDDVSLIGVVSIGTPFRLKVVVTGDQHKFYVDDNLVLEVTDSTFTGPGGIGMFHRSTSPVNTEFDNVQYTPVTQATIIPEAYLFASDYTGTDTTTFSAPIPTDVEVGDFVIVQATVNEDDYPSTDDDGWMFMGSVNHVVEPSAATFNGSTRWYGKVIDGTEPGTVSFYNYNSTASGWASVAVALRAGSYSLPRGQAITKSVFTDPFTTGGIGAGWTTASAHARHNPHYSPYDDAEDTLLLSFFGSTASASYGVAPLTDFDYSTGITSSATIPRAAVSGQVLSGAQDVPFAIADWTKGDVNNRYATALLSIPSNILPVKPRCILMHRRSSGGSESTTADVFNVSGLSASQDGDLQILVMNINGGSGNTITLSEDFDQVIKFGSRIVVYKRIFNSAIHTDQVTYTSTSGISYLHTLYAFPVGTYDPSGDVIAVAQTGSSTTSVTCPAVTGDSSYDGLNNFVIQHVVREGNAVNNGNGIQTFPTECKYIRNQTFNQGSSSGRVSYASAGKYVVGSSSAAETYTFGTGSNCEVVSIMVKGIDGVQEALLYWDEAFSDSGMLTFDDATVTREAGSDGTWAVARSADTTTDDGDLIYFEVQNVQGGAIPNGMRVGFMDDTVTDDTGLPAGGATSVQVTLGNFDWATGGDNLMVAVNRSSDKLWVGVNGVWNNGYDPADNGTAYSSCTIAGTGYAFAAMSYADQAGKLATRSNEFLYTVPTGFKGLGDPEPVPAVFYTNNVAGEYVIDGNTMEVADPLVATGRANVRSATEIDTSLDQDVYVEFVVEETGGDISKIAFGLGRTSVYSKTGEITWGGAMCGNDLQTILSFVPAISISNGDVISLSVNGSGATAYVTVGVNGQWSYDPESSPTLTTFNGWTLNELACFSVGLHDATTPAGYSGTKIRVRTAAADMQYKPASYLAWDDAVAARS